MADVLSRRIEDMDLKLISRSYWHDVVEIDEEVRKDPTLSRIITDLKANPDSHPHYTLEHDRLYYKGRLVLATSSSWIPKLLDEFHASPAGGHSGVYGTYRRVAQSLYWIGMKGTISTYVPCMPKE